MPVELRNAQRRIRVDVRRVKRVAEKLLEGLRREKMVLSLLLTGDRQMATLHERWMGDPSPTDVLSFPMKAVRPEPVEGQRPRLLGDIAISVEMAARRHPRDPMKEIEKYLIHGILHLVGHDHVRAVDHKKMSAEARRLSRLIAKEH